MQTNITGHHIDVTPALREYVETKLDKLARHFDYITSASVTLTVDKLIHRAEARVHVSGADLYANSESEDMYAAIDILADKLNRQLMKHKEKRVDRRHSLNR